MLIGLRSPSLAHLPLYWRLYRCICQVNWRSSWQALGQAVVIDNKPGAGGMIALSAAAKGLTRWIYLLLALTNQSISYSALSASPADLTKDFVPVALVGSIPHLIVINPSVPARIYPELIAFIKSKKGDFNYALSGQWQPFSFRDHSIYATHWGYRHTHPLQR